MKLPEDFYLQDDVVAVARQLLGKVICTKINGALTAGMICETEAYAGAEDRASHAWNNRRTARTEVMYQQGGISYVYLCYGIHHLFNVVTAQQGIPHAILLRGIFPMKGMKKMEERRKMSVKQKSFANGPGKASQALGITIAFNAINLQSKLIWIEDEGIEIEEPDVLTGPRIGVAYAGEDAELPYRFWLEPNFLT